MIGYTGLVVAGFSPAVGALDAQEHLASRAAAGDREAFVVIYREHFSEVRAFAQRLLGCPMAADDLVHDLFIGLPKALRSFRGDCPLKNFLIAIAIRSANNHLRAAKRRRQAEDRSIREPLLNATRPDVDFEQQELARLLNRALDCLPLDQRVAFVLCEIEERTSAEAGEILGEQAGTVRARVFHAKRRLREELEALAAERGLSTRKGASRD